MQDAAPGPLTHSPDEMHAGAFARRHPLVAFTVVQIVGWSLYFVVQFQPTLSRLSDRGRDAYLILEFIMIGTAPVVSTLLLLAYRGILARSIPGGVPVLTLLVVLAIWTATQVWIVLDGALISLVVSRGVLREDVAEASRLMGGSYFAMLVTWTAAFFAIRFWWQLQARERAVLRYQLSAREAQLRALSYQLNPHFLFNAINSLRALILEDRERAREMVTRLAGFLRSALAIPAHPENSLAEEITLLQDYLAIEQVRFEQRLVVTWDVSNDALTCSVPGLILQPLVENAIRHGAERDGRLEVHVSAQLREGDLFLSVRNTGILGRAGAAAGGIGLANVKSRLEHAYPGRHTVSLRDANGMVVADVSIQRVGSIE